MHGEEKGGKKGLGKEMGQIKKGGDEAGRGKRDTCPVLGIVKCGKPRGACAWGPPTLEVNFFANI